MALPSHTSLAGSPARLFLLPVWHTAVTSPTSDREVRAIALLATSSMPMDLTTSAESRSTLRYDLRRSNSACEKGAMA